MVVPNRLKRNMNILFEESSPLRAGRMSIRYSMRVKYHGSGDPWLHHLGRQSKMDSTTEGEFNSLRAPFRSRGSDNTRFGVFGRIGTSVQQRPYRTVKVGGFTHRPTPPVSPSLLQSDFERLLTVASNWNTVRRRPNSPGCGDCVRDSPTGHLTRGTLAVFSLDWIL